MQGSSDAIAIASMVNSTNAPVVVITTSSRDAEITAESIQFYSSRETSVTVFPGWECLPYDNFSPHQDILSQRVKILSTIPYLSSHILVVSIDNLMQRLPPVDYVRSTSFALSIGTQINLNQFLEQLNRTAYRRVLQVEMPGEYALRGAVIDLYPMGASYPIRMELLGEQIDTLRYFDPETQLSIEKTDRVEVLPGGEVPLDSDSIRRLRQGVRQYLSGDPSKNEIYSAIDSEPIPNGTEFYLPLFFESTSTLLDYLPHESLIFSATESKRKATQFWEQVQERFQIASSNDYRLPLPPEMLYVPPPELSEILDHKALIEFDEHSQSQGFEFDTVDPGSKIADKRSPKVESQIGTYLSSVDADRCLFVVENASQRQSVESTLQKLGKSYSTVTSWHKFIDSPDQYAVHESNLLRGTYLGREKILIIAGAELFGRQLQVQKQSERRRNPEAVIASMEELTIGEPVVHEHYGIGRYRGLTTMKIEETETEFMTLEYLHEETLYVPIYSINLVSRYIGGNSEEVALNSLSSKKWSTQKSKARMKAYDIAVELLQVQSLRESQPGNRMQVPQADYLEFVSQFPYQETPDQLKAIDSVFDDLSRHQPMDRVICGDVGFGKTEIAMRAALVTVANGFQAAVVVPTTLLAQQHFEVFRNRFIDLGVRVAALSRLVTPHQTKKIKNDLEEGKIDIVIGTHQLLQPTVKFAKLGLFIVDEEHRFGVRQKEHLKKVRANVDILTLTATPIPRTLSMALNGIRDISILATPPDERLSVRTFVRDWKPGIVREACLRELARGGQIFYVHNKVRTINYAARELKKIVPEANIAIAHGQMPKVELEDVMRNFYAQKFDTLVCSTIIESGIDIPSANTIIVNHASNFGLAQLHQLRGRVGRSHHQAYAYFLVASREHLSSDASRRLEGIAELDQLGVGYLIATHDMEIRGAGAILGEEQSGTIDGIGYGMYSSYLTQAINTLSQSGNEIAVTDFANELPSSETQINLHTPALFPEDWIPSTKIRLTLYRRIAEASNEETLNRLKSEMIDRFGSFPSEATALFHLYRIKLTAQSLGVLKLDLHVNYGQVVFDQNGKFDMEGLKNLIAYYPGSAKLNPSDSSLRLKHYLNSGDKRLRRAFYILETLASSERVEPDKLAVGSPG